MNIIRCDDSFFEGDVPNQPLWSDPKVRQELQEGNYLIQSCIFENMNSDKDGSVISLNQVKTKTLIKSCGFKNIHGDSNTEIYGGALYFNVLDYSKIKVESCYATECYSNSMAGFLYISADDSLSFPDITSNIDYCTITNCQSKISSCYLIKVSELVNSVNLSYNKCNIAAAIVFVDPMGDLTSKFRYSNVADNEASERTICQFEESQHEMKHCNVISNTVPSNNNAINAVIFASDSNIEIENCYFNSNTPNYLFGAGGTSWITSEIKIISSNIDEDYTSYSSVTEKPGSSSFQTNSHKFIKPDEIWEEIPIAKPLGTFDDKRKNFNLDFIKVYFIISWED